MHPMLKFINLRSFEFHIFFKTILPFLSPCRWLISFIRDLETVSKPGSKLINWIILGPRYKGQEKPFLAVGVGVVLDNLWGGVAEDYFLGWSSRGVVYRVE